MWTPDIYQAAPAPVTAFVATVSKGAMVAVLLRYLRAIGVHDHVGRLLDALRGRHRLDGRRQPAGPAAGQRQAHPRLLVDRPPRLHPGAVRRHRAHGRHGGDLLRRRLHGHQPGRLRHRQPCSARPTTRREDIDDYRGLGQRRPWLAATFAASLFSLAGIPLTVGFVGKFYLLTAGTGASIWALAVVLVLTSTIGLYYYTRIVVAMYVQKPEADTASAAVPRASAAVAGSSVLGITAAVLVWLGVYPGPLLHLIEHAVRTLP